MRRIVKPLIIALLWLGIWEALHLIVGLEVLLPSPAATIRQLIALCGEFAFWQSIVFSMGRVLLGLCLGIFVGIIMAIITSAYSLAQAFFTPLLSVIKSTPVASFIVLALVWLNKGIVPVFTSFLIVLPIVWGNVQQGIKNTDHSLLEMADAFGMNFSGKIKHIFIQSVWPYFTVSATMSIGMAWKAGIAAEVIATPLYSIGKGIYNSKIYLNTTELFAWTIAIIVLSLILEKMISHLLTRKAVGA